MQVEAENYGPVVILHISGSVATAEVQAFLQEMVAKCGSVSHIVITMTRADITLPVAKPLIALRDQQRFLKPTVWLVSPKLEQADTGTLAEVLPALETAEALQIAKINALKVDHSQLSSMNSEVDVKIRQMLDLGEGYKVEEYDEARNKMRERNQIARRLAAATSGHVEQLKKACASVAKIVETMTPEDRADAVKRIADSKAKAYAAVRGG